MTDVCLFLETGLRTRALTLDEGQTQVNCGLHRQEGEHRTLFRGGDGKYRLTISTLPL